MEVNEKPEVLNSETMNIEGEGFSNLIGKIPTSGGTKNEEEIEETDEQKEAREKLEAEELEEKNRKPEDNNDDDDDDVEKEDTGKVDYASILENLSESLGIELDDELEIEPNKEGLNILTKALVDKARKDAKAEAFSEVNTKFPVVNELIQHLESGASISSFQREQELQSFRDFEITEETDPIILENIYRSSLNAKNIVGEEQEELIESAKDSDRMFDKAVSGKAFLVTNEDKLIEQDKQAEIKANKDAQIENERVQETIKKTLESKTLLSYKLSDEDATKLKKAIYDTDEQGYSERDKAWAKLSVEEMMFLDHIVLNKFKPLGIKTDEKEKTFLKIKGKSSKEEKKEKPDLTGTGGGSKNKVKISSIRDFIG